MKTCGFVIKLCGSRLQPITAQRRVLIVSAIVKGGILVQAIFLVLLLFRANLCDVSEYINLQSDTATSVSAAAGEWLLFEV